MSETRKESKAGGWIKTILGTLAGLLSGAVVMYLSPYLDKVVKGAKPIANFAVEHSGLTVTFQNRSVGGDQGYWDFGDGSPLEFVSAEQTAVTHTYPRPGTYQAKFVLKNKFNEESDRSVTIELKDATSKPADQPAILDLYARPPGKVGQPVYAPATFQFEATVDHAEHYVWDFGDGSGIQMGNHEAAHTFTSPGSYTVRLVAFNGKQKHDHDVAIDVAAAPTGMLSVNVNVADQGTQVETRRREAVASHALPIGGKDSPATIQQTIAAGIGYEIMKVDPLRHQNTNVQNVRYQIAPDKKSVKVIAQVAKVSSPTSAVLNERLVLTEQRRAKASRDPIPVMTTVAVPGNVTLRLPPVPEDWTEVQRQYAFELRQNDKVIWRGSDLPKNVPVNLNGKRYTLLATQAGERVQVNLATTN